MRKLVLSMMAIATLLVAGCESMKGNGEDNSTSMKKASLYERLGGAPAITAVVDDFVGHAVSDPKVNFARRGVPGAEWQPTPENVAHLKTGLVNFITMATGGPNDYKGKSISGVHKNMQITEAEFSASAADLKAALDDKKIPAGLQKELLDIVGKTKKEIVTKM